MATHRTRVGLHARNDVHFPERDYELVRRARIETLKTMSFTDVKVYERLRAEHPNIEFIVRLYDGRLGQGSRPAPADFVGKMLPFIKRLRPFATKFEIHNEPNHAAGIEGWGSTDQDARAFRDWYRQVLAALKASCPWARFGFPGLALNHPHRDLEWLSICSDVIRASDWLGCHAYWQYGNMLSSQWGLRFELYHERFPNKQIEITEFADSTPNLAAEKMADQYAKYYQELNKYPYLGSASAFIASSPDPAWAPFAWATEGGQMLPVIDAVAEMPRKAVEIAPPSPPEPETPATPTPAVAERTFPQTGKTVQGAFLQFYEKHGQELFGYPITDQIEEDGVVVQFFQNVAIKEAEAGKVQFRPVGTEAWSSRQTILKLEGERTGFEERIKSLQAEIERLGGEPTPAAGPEPSWPEFSGKADPGEISAPPIQNMVGKLQVHKTKRYSTRPRSAIQILVIHHSAVSATVGPQRIAVYHVTSLDWPGVGYHFMIDATGTIYQANEPETISYHAAGANSRGVGICFLGNFTDQIPPPAQLEAGAWLVAWLKQELGLGSDSVKGHRELVQTACPGNQWLLGMKWKEMLSQEIAKVEEKAAKAVQPAGLLPKVLHHYILLPTQDGAQVAGAGSGQGGAWTPEGWLAIQAYVQDSQPTIGFSVSDAVKAETVTIFGGTKEISPEAEAWLRAYGCKVERIVPNA